MTATLTAVSELTSQLDRAADLGIDSFPRLRVLLALHLAPQTMAALARTAGISGAAMTSHIDHLEHLALVRRTRPPADRRIIKIELTSSGRRITSHILGA